MGVGVLFDLVNFRGNTCCFNLVSKLYDLYVLHPSFYQKWLTGETPKWQFLNRAWPRKISP